MSDIAISVKNLKKVYKIYDHPGDRIKEAFSIRKKKYSTNYTALHDVNFEIKKGEFCGVIGRNGAGKSTLLKLLSRELTPTEGEITVNGQVSLLQIGVGFDAELSGIENTIFASRIMGYSDDQIKDVIAKVTEFAEIGEFIHHPVKTYSTGMYSRLSFAIAINIDPEILIVDEVLSVGDITFSQKCLRKMHDFKNQGKTIVLVSHDPGAVSVFCDRAIWIKDSTIYEMGDAKQVSEDYRNFMMLSKLPDHIEKNKPGYKPRAEEELLNKDSEIKWMALSKLPQVSDEALKIEGFAVYNKYPFEQRVVFKGDEELVLFMKLRASRDLEEATFSWNLYDKNGLMALHTNNSLCETYVPLLPANQSIVVNFEFKLPGLNNGDFIFCITAGQKMETYCRIHDIFPIKVERYTTEKERQYGYVHIKQQTCNYDISEEEIRQKYILGNVSSAEV